MFVSGKYEDALSVEEGDRIRFHSRTRDIMDTGIVGKVLYHGMKMWGVKGEESEYNFILAGIDQVEKLDEEKKTEKD